jgi:hypothetical protein
VTLTPGDLVQVTTMVTVDGLIWGDGTAMMPFLFFPKEVHAVVDVRPGAVKVSDTACPVWIPSRLVEKCG